LETSPPEEAVVAAARIFLNAVDKSGIVDLFAAYGPMDLSKQRYCRLLLKLESIVQAHNYDHLIVEVPQWSEGIQSWLSEVGYEDRGGKSWPDDKEDLLIKPTMIFLFKKTFRSGSITVASAEAPSPAINTGTGTGTNRNLEDLMRGLLLGGTATSAANTSVSQDDIDSSDSQSYDTSSGGMDDLFESLFRALHAEYPP
jgi:hypothetical protein